MKAEQLPGDLEEWLKTQTIVIGGAKWLAADGDTYAQRGDKERRKRSPFAQIIRIPRGVKLVPLFKFMPRSLAFFATRRVTNATAGSPTRCGAGLFQLI